MTTVTLARVSLALCVVMTLTRAVPPNITTPGPGPGPGPVPVPMERSRFSKCSIEQLRCRQLLHYCPQCDIDGNFVPTQCSLDRGSCWCVDVITGVMLPGTYTEPGLPPVDCDCPIGWTKFKNRCYIFIGTEKKWSQAELYCQFDGANLASIHSYEESQFVMSLTREGGHNFPETWIGGYDAIFPGLWMWSDGTKFYYENWHDLSTTSSTQDCLKMNFGIDWKWTHDLCTNLHPFVCAKDIKHKT